MTPSTIVVTLTNKQNNQDRILINSWIGRVRGLEPYVNGAVPLDLLSGRQRIDLLDGSDGRHIATMERR